jgi:hypothetical protein
MDNQLLHLGITSIFGIIIAILGFFLKNSFSRLERLEHEFVNHKIEDASKWSEFASHKEEVSRRLEVIDNKLDKLLER